MFRLEVWTSRARVYALMPYMFLDNIEGACSSFRPVADSEIEHQRNLLHPNPFAFSLPIRFSQCQQQLSSHPPVVRFLVPPPPHEQPNLITEVEALIGSSRWVVWLKIGVLCSDSA